MNWIQLDDAEIKKRFELQLHLQAMIKAHLPTVNVYMFGSTANRLAFPGSDIDLLLMGDNYAFGDLFKAIELIMLNSGEFEYVDAISTAQVPIIQAMHKKTDISMDIVINREDGLRGLSLVSTMLEEYVELRPIYFVLKAFLKYKNLHKPYKGGIGSFVLVNMIVVYLQTHYKLGNPPMYLQDHIIKFLEFYVHKLEFSKVGVSIREGGFFFDKDHEYLSKPG